MLDAIRSALIAGRRPHESLEASDQPCIYAIFLQPRGLLLPIMPGAEGVLYIGSAANTIEVHNHFAAPSGASDLRRTLGAILRRHLGLFPAQGAPPSDAALETFVFAYDGELILSRWMRANLLVSVVPAEAPVCRPLESALITDLRPPLNLAGWENPRRPVIEKFCADALRLAKETGRAAA
jgi:hypothetical protein